MLTEYKRRCAREYSKQYRITHKEKRKEIETRRRIKHRVTIKQQWKKWYDSHRQEELADKKLYFEKVLQNNPQYYAVIKRTSRIKKLFEWRKMHTSEKLLIDLKRLLDNESSTFMSTLDTRHWNQIKPRLEACILLAEKWKEEFDILHGKIK